MTELNGTVNKPIVYMTLLPWECHLSYIALCVKWKFFVFSFHITLFRIAPGGTVVKNLPANAGELSRDESLIPVLGRSPGGGNGNPLQYSCLENSMDRRAWWAIVHRVSKSRTWLSDWAHTHKYSYCRRNITKPH